MPHRRHLLSQLSDYARRHPSRADVAERMRRFVEQTPRCFERSCAVGHITGSAWLLNPARDKALLTLHRKLRRWLQPGGHADGDPCPLRVALREASEESGISGISPLSADIFDIDIHTIPPHPAGGAPEHLHFDVRFLLIAPHERFCASAESLALAWVSPAEMQHLRPAVDDSVWRMANLAAHTALIVTT